MRGDARIQHPRRAQVRVLFLRGSEQETPRPPWGLQGVHGAALHCTDADADADANADADTDTDTDTDADAASAARPHRVQPGS